MIDIRTVIYIIIGLITIGGAVVGFFQMQTRQNMKIAELEKEVIELKRRLAEQSRYQIATEKMIEVINTKLDSIQVSIDKIEKKLEAK